MHVIKPQQGSPYWTKASSIGTRCCTRVVRQRNGRWLAGCLEVWVHVPYQVLHGALPRKPLGSKYVMGKAMPVCFWPASRAC